jgi:hypothetical protein
VLAALLTLLWGSAAVAGPPVVGMDWPTGRLRVLGVGTPRLLSPTGSLLLEDATELARAHARRRLAEAMLALPVPAGEAEGARQMAAGRAAGLVRFGTPRTFSDGTVHLPAELDVFAALGHGSPPAEPALTVPAPVGFTPCMRLLLRGPVGEATGAGLPGDPTPHLRYVHGPTGAPPGADAGGAGSATPTTNPTPCVLTIAGPAPKSIRVVLPGGAAPAAGSGAP